MSNKGTATVDGWELGGFHDPHDLVEARLERQPIGLITKRFGFSSRSL